MPCKRKRGNNRQSETAENDKLKQRKCNHAPNIRSSTLSLSAAPSKYTLTTTKQQKDYPQRKSLFESWRRAFLKHRASTETALSPLKAAQANLTHVVPKLKDKYLDLYTWAVNMSEQLCYDNAFVLLGCCRGERERMRAVLHRGFVAVDIGFFWQLEEVTLLGQGSFGTVFSCLDRKTGLRYAVKHLSAAFKKSTDHAANLINYLDERNAIIRAMDSPLVVKFFYSLQIKITGALFLFFEFCIGDLNHYVDKIYIDRNTAISKMLDEHVIEIVQNIHRDQPDILEVSILYVFEMFCGVDFLVKCNIIHQDIKPGNIMISDNLHLKIGDFGLTYKTRTIHRETNKLLVKVNDINLSESTNYELSKPGTIFFQDFELQLMNQEVRCKREFNKVIEDKEKFNVHKIRFNHKVLEPTFLVDTWAVGVSALMLLFRGFEIFNPEHIDKSILKGVPRSNITSFLIHVTARKEIYTHYIKHALINAGGQSHKELMTFIASIFRPRLDRCVDYTKERKVYHFTEIIEMRYVDMEKVEKFRTFSQRNFNRSNIHLRNIPEMVRGFFKSDKKPTFLTFKNFLDDIEEKRLKLKKPGAVLGVDPGVTINFFN